MAFDAFIKIEGVPGEALDEKYRDWIEITGYSFGTHQSTSATASSAGGASSGRTTMTTLHLTHFPSKKPARWDERNNVKRLNTWRGVR